MLSNTNADDNTLTYVLDGVMNIRTINNFWHQILEKLVSHDKVNLYIEDSNNQSFTLNAILIVTLFPIEYADKFHKIAFVTDGQKSKALDQLERMLSRVSIRNFPLEKRKKALTWVREVN